MFWAIHIALLILLALIIYQDFKWRGIHWLILPFLASSFLFFSLQENSIIEVLNNALINFCFVLLQFLFVSVWFSIKSKKLVNIFRQHIGIGDWLFFVCLCFAFSPFNFILFLISALIISLFIHLVILIFLKNAERTVPLAGLVAIMLMGVLIIESIFYPGKLQNDSYLINLIGIYYV